MFFILFYGNRQDVINARNNKGSTFFKMLLISSTNTINGLPGTGN